MSESIDELLRDYPVTLELPVQWGDMDSFAHVNNLVYLRWFESGRVAYMEKMGAMGAEAGDIGPILGHMDCRYRIPLEYPDRITVGVRVTEIGEDRFTLHHRVVSHQHRKVAAEGGGVIVCVDYKRGGKAPLPDAWREAITRLEG
ncbi:thioesterase family protein [Motiliproteus sp. SC1-56]|uniref:acyl-CoA thioesterase n=1 Tax=Motiliproteus sp. SC1-56 TaxID=2799565 RepID=UPI001A8DED6D|nr:thioesterase family protein [Motiliproteus sp. SC1-56]